VWIGLRVRERVKENLERLDQRERERVKENVDRDIT